MKTSKNLTGTYAVFTGVLLISIILTAFTTSRLHQKMDELTVKRINIIEDDGTIRMVISNKARQHPGRMDGLDLPERERSAGLIFFNDEGDETGGLIYEVKKVGDAFTNGMSITMDQFKHDQALQLLNSEYIVDGKVIAQRGLAINTFPEGATLTEYMKAIDDTGSIKDDSEKQQKMTTIQKELGPINSLFVGRSQDGNHGLFIMDKNGIPRLMLYVDGEGVPKIQTIDENMQPKDLIAP